MGLFSLNAKENYYSERCIIKKNVYVDRAFDAMKLTTRELYRHITNSHINTHIQTCTCSFLSFERSSKNKKKISHFCDVKFSKAVSLILYSNRIYSMTFIEISKKKKTFNFAYIISTNLAIEILTFKQKKTLNLKFFHSRLFFRPIKIRMQMINY